jgi:hypothetical protein
VHAGFVERIPKFPPKGPAMKTQKRRDKLVCVIAQNFSQGGGNSQGRRACIMRSSRREEALIFLSMVVDGWAGFGSRASAFRRFPFASDARHHALNPLPHLVGRCCCDALIFLAAISATSLSLIPVSPTTKNK